MSGRFYLSALPLCNESGCKRPAEFEVLGPHGALYGHFCKRHADKRRVHLERIWAQTPTDKMART